MRESHARLPGFGLNTFAALCVAAGSALPLAAQGDASVAQPCVRVSSIDHTKIVDKHNILFYLRNDSVLQNVVPQECPGLTAPFSKLTYDVQGDRLCAGSVVGLLMDRGGDLLRPGALVATSTCKIGMFLPIGEDEVASLLASASAHRKEPKKKESGSINAEPVELPAPPGPAPSPSAPR